MTIKYLGHSCFHIKIGDKYILTDPFISGNPLAAGINPDELPVDYLILTHGHSDHVLDAERILKRTNATVISSFEIVTWYGEKGFQGHAMNTGGKFTFDFGTVRAVNAIHSSVLPDGTYGANPLGFVIYNDDISFYLAGDTALTMDMKLIPMVCPPLDFAVLPMGDNFTMGYEDIPFASEFIQCKTIIGCHFDTFDIIKVNKEEVTSFLKGKGIEINLLDIGGSKEF